MLITIAAAAMVMAAYFLLLYGGVGFIQDKRFSALLTRTFWLLSPKKSQRDSAVRISLAG